MIFSGGWLWVFSNYYKKWKETRNTRIFTPSLFDSEILREAYTSHCEFYVTTPAIFRCQTAKGPPEYTWIHKVEKKKSSLIFDFKLYFILDSPLDEQILKLTAMIVIIISIIGFSFMFPTFTLCSKKNKYSSNSKNPSTMSRKRVKRPAPASLSVYLFFQMLHILASFLYSDWSTTIKARNWRKGWRKRWRTKGRSSK